MKRGQMELSFGMIFSIILIIAFIAFAFYAIDKFLGMQRTLETGNFIEGFQSDVDRLWRGSQGSQEVVYSVPSKVKMVCLIDYNSNARGSKEIYSELDQLFYEKENLFFYPIGSTEGIDAAKIEHIDLGNITAEKNPYCVNATKGKINFVLKKDYNNPLVAVK